MRGQRPNRAKRPKRHYPIKLYTLHMRCPLTVHRCACCLGVERGTLTLNIHIVADTPEGLHLDNRWSVSAANATTGCYSLSHHTPKGGYTREEQRVYR